MSSIAILCKSYLPDMHRAKVMVESVLKYNREKLPLYMSVPETDLPAFKQAITHPEVNWLTDESIIRANPALDLQIYHLLSGAVSQQIVKAEFWRVCPSENYVCIDSDSRFIRDFRAEDFQAEDGTPFTVLFEDKPYQLFCLAQGIRETSTHYEKMSAEMKTLFERKGPTYSYNPFPVVWSRKVWEVLASDLAKRGSNILQAITSHPYESSWYGEALLKFQPVRLIPVEPLFKAYLYPEEYLHDRKMGINEEILSRYYLGVVYQSNWYPHRLKLHKRLAYWLKRKIQRIRT